jgi:hypothetical protein
MSNGDGRHSTHRHKGATSTSSKSSRKNVTNQQVHNLEKTIAKLKADLAKDQRVIDALKKEVSQGQQTKTNQASYSPSVGAGLSGYKWNLPPHEWSLPIEPSDDPLIVNSEAYVLGSLPKFRRGRIYWYSRVDNTYVDTSSYNTGVVGRYGAADHSKDPRYGFQFLWNPDNFSTSVAVNMNVTPTFADKFVSVVGAFPSGEYLTVTLRIDRTNDFACIKSIPDKSKIHLGNSPQSSTAYEQLAQNYVSYYKPIYSLDGSDENTVSKIVDLQKYGTIADLEYLYKAINGPGWKNQATGSESSDIGFLSPTLLRIDIGPLSYLGYVNNMTVNHNGFSKDMVPIRTDVTLQFNLMATAGLSSK